MPLPRTGPRALGEDGLAGSDPLERAARITEDPHAAGRNLMQLVRALRLRLQSLRQRALVQGAHPSSWRGSSRGLREPSALALAASGAGVRFSRPRRFGQEA